MRTSVSEYNRSTTQKSIHAILRSLGTSYSDHVLSLLQSSDWGGFSRLDLPSPGTYGSDVSKFARDYLAYSLVRKADFLPSGIDKARVSLASFRESEERCRMINDNHARDPNVIDLAPLNESFEAIIHMAKGKIADCLGTFSWDRVEPYFAFTSGASSRLRRVSGAPFYKYQGIPEASRSNCVLAVCAIWHSPMWRQACLESQPDPMSWVRPVRGSVLTTVPKSFKTDRTICKETDMDMYIQKGFGTYIKNCLRQRANIDLRSQETNQELAKAGSLEDSLATLDLSAASDSISLSVVEALLPSSWFKALCQCRASETQMPDGSWHTLQKISSMGNGYTFELETLIFWALTQSVIDVLGLSDRRSAVYGDDIIIHKDGYDRLVGVLNYLGFSVNTDKSFRDGPFRESCGKHYFMGHDVSPFYIKKDLTGMNRAFWLLNSFRLWISRCDPCGDYGSVIKYLFKILLPDPKSRITVPPHFSSESGLYVSSVMYANRRFSSAKQGWAFTYLRPQRRKHKPNGLFALMSWFNGLPVSNDRFESNPLLWVDKSELLLEKGNTRYVLSKNTTSSWGDLTIAFGETW